MLKVTTATILSRNATFFPSRKVDSYTLYGGSGGSVVYFQLFCWIWELLLATLLSSSKFAWRGVAIQ